MKIIMYVYRPSYLSPLPVEVVFSSDEPDYAEIQHIAKAYGISGAVERVRVLFDPVDGQHATNGTPADMLVDDMSAVECHPVNDAATAIYHAARLKRDPRAADVEDWPKIYGVALVFDKQIWF